MAFSAVYVSIARVPRDSRASERKSFSNISATTAAFELRGGEYTLDVIATGTGSATLQRLGPDGTTWITAMTAVTTSATAVTADLPDGSYRVAIA